MNKHEVETMAREAFGPEPEPIESSPMTFGRIALALLVSIAGTSVVLGLMLAALVRG